MDKPSLFFLLLAGAIFMVNNTQATETASPPLQYPLAQVNISVLHQPGRGAIGAYKIAIAGNGQANYERENDEEAKKSVRSPSAQELTELLNEFYRIHFFELQDTYAVKKQVVLQSDNTFATTGRKILDASRHTLCVQLAEYKKCVTIIDNQPNAASELVKKIEALFVHH